MNRLDLIRCVDRARKASGSAARRGDAPADAINRLRVRAGTFVGPRESKSARQRRRRHRAGDEGWCSICIVRPARTGKRTCARCPKEEVRRRQARALREALP